jgi:hypothetical protein
MSPLMFLRPIPGRDEAGARAKVVYPCGLQPGCRAQLQGRAAIGRRLRAKTVAD